MGAFNTIKAESACPFCGKTQVWTIQFKYGNCWQFEYKIGDKLRWGGNKKGRKVNGNIRTEGIAEGSCINCSRNFINAAVYVSDNILQKVEMLQQSLNLEGNYEALD